MVKNHMKRINAPKSWNILRKVNKFISRQNPGRQKSMCMSLNTALKDVLGKTKTTKETKYLIRYRQVLVNGAQRFDEKFPVGFLDVLSLPETQEHFRLLINAKGMLEFIPVTESESKIKMSKVGSKLPVKGGRMQVLCTDGRTFLMQPAEAEKIATNDTLVYTVPDQKIQSSLRMEKGNLAFLYKGKHTGSTVKIEGFKGSNIVFHDGKEELETRKAYAFVVGKDKPVMKIRK